MNPQPHGTGALPSASQAETTCPVCGQTAFRRRELVKGVCVNTCTGCGFLISELTPLGPIQAEFSGIDETAYHRAIGVLRRHQARSILDFISPFRPGRNWLDIGCSFGVLLDEARRAGFEIIGVEPDPTAAAQARALLGAGAVLQGVMTDASRPDASADVISTLDVLEHVPAPALTDFALLVRRKLRPGGLWVIKLPSTDGLYFKLAHKLLPFARPLLTGVIRRLWQSDYEYPHTVYFNRETLQRFLEIHGFEPLGFTYLAEVPSGTVLDRLRMDPAIPRWLALLYAPGFYLINAIEGLRGKSDALLAVVRRPH